MIAVSIYNHICEILHLTFIKKAFALLILWDGVVQKCLSKKMMFLSDFLQIGYNQILLVLAPLLAALNWWPPPPKNSS